MLICCYQRMAVRRRAQSIKALALVAATVSGGILSEGAAQPVDIAEMPSRPFPYTSIKELGETPPTEATKVAKPVGGKPADPSQFKWQVAIIESSASSQNPFRGFFCGGSLIAWQWVLTAAHCTFDKTVPVKAKDIHVYLGSHDFQGGERIAVKAITRHEAYNRKNSDNDLALLQLEREPQDRSKLELLTLVTAEEELKLGHMGTVVGWGSTAPGIVLQRSPIKKLQFIDRVEVRSSDDCNRSHLQDQRAYVSQYLRSRGASNATIRETLAKRFPPDVKLITDNMVCAGTHDGSQDACFGDSGGPLVVRTRRGLVQAGVVSWGPGGGCALTNLYGVYVRLSRFLDWIEKRTK